MLFHFITNLCCCYDENDTLCGKYVKSYGSEDKTLLGVFTDDAKIIKGLADDMQADLEHLDLLIKRVEW